MKPSSWFNQKNFPDLEFDSLQDADCIYFNFAARKKSEKSVDYQMECFGKGMDENPLKLKQMKDESLRLFFTESN